MRYVIPEIPPSNNKYIGRNARWDYREEKKRWEQLIFALCRPHPTEPLRSATVRIKYCFPDKRRRDPDNYSGKMILDGLTRSGIIADDSFFNITLILCAEFGCKDAKTVIDIF